MKLEDRIERLEDIEAVRNTWYEYILRADGGSQDEFVDVFTKDCVVDMVGLDGGDGTYSGRESIINDFYGRFQAPGPQAASGHHGTTGLRVEVDGDEATTMAYFFEIVYDDLFLSGTYQHRMRREPDRWRIAYLRIAVTFRCQLGLVSPRSSVITHPGPRSTPGS